MVEVSLGELIARGRAEQGLSRQEVADATNYSAVMIAKIESGERLPDESRLPTIAHVLGLDLADLTHAASRLDRRKSSGPKIVDAMKLAKRNDERARDLRSRAQQVRIDVDITAKKLRELVNAFDANVLLPLSSALSQIDAIPLDAIVHDNVEDHESNPDFAASLRTAQRKTGASVHALLSARVLQGDGAAAQMSGIAAASTGFVIMGLSEVPPTWSTLAEIVTLAAPAIGATAGKNFAAAIAVLPVTFAVNALVSGGRVLSKQEEAQRRLDSAQQELEQAELAVSKFIARASRITEILTVALFAAKTHLKRIESAIPVRGRVAFEALDPAARDSMGRMAELTFASLAVLTLPIGLHVVAGEDSPALADESSDDPTRGQIEPAFELGSKLENDFIDYVIEEVFAQVAR
ncbi:helix-turn-helix transcriptional regulator [Microbacterium sp. KSW2-21]|uniref:Helix-turn-helix transcriptional regulator n=1 Tax=Microbacterium algihabitans TaxID=3075992 RepID=A0ABU3RV52_9MICO|nr:helix-turn-helix transcriptional regulator [Microbacterium sp. KSW2-21]MDU0326318.1 helix-turn-helix transcriptional regulator [Microbacterium sp. KSW2-21]